MEARERDDAIRLEAEVRRVLTSLRPIRENLSVETDHTAFIELRGLDHAPFGLEARGSVVRSLARATKPRSKLRLNTIVRVLLAYGVVEVENNIQDFVRSPTFRRTVNEAKGAEFGAVDDERHPQQTDDEGLTTVAQVPTTAPGLPETVTGPPARRPQSQRVPRRIHRRRFQGAQVLCVSIFFFAAGAALSWLLAPRWVFSSLVASVTVAGLTPAQAGPPDRYSNTNTAWYWRDCPTQVFPCGSAGLKHVDVNLSPSGHLDVVTVGSAPNDPFWDPKAVAVRDISPNEFVTSMDSAGVRPVAMAGYATPQGARVYAVAAGSLKGRGWSFVDSTSVQGLQAWLLARPSYRPYFLDRVVIGTRHHCVMLAEPIPAGSGSARIFRNVSTSQIRSLIVPGQTLAVAFQEARTAGKFDIIIRNFGPTERPYFCEFISGPTPQIRRPGAIWAGTDRPVSYVEFMVGSVQHSAAIVVDNAWRFRQTYTAACSGTGIPAPQLNLHTQTDVRPGAIVTASVTLAAPSGMVAFLLGSRRDRWGRTQLPLDLAPLGAPGCELGTAADVVVGVTTNVFGHATIKLPIPLGSAPGTRIYIQAVTMRPRANALGALLAATYLIEVE